MMTTIRPILRWGGYQWVTQESRRSIGDETIERITREDVLAGAKKAGVQPIKDPQTSWHRVLDLRMQNWLQVPDFLGDDDWQLRCSVKCLGPTEEVDETDLQPVAEIPAQHT